jgi:integrase
MKLADAVRLNGLVHNVVIGHRVAKRPDGSTLVCKPWYATWTQDGHWKCTTLRTTNKNLAIRRARELDDRLSQGLGLPPKAMTVQSLIEGYMLTKRAERRAGKTLSKYQFVLKEFHGRLPTEMQANAGKLSSAEFDRYSIFLTDEKKVSEHSWSDRLTIVKQLGRWAENEGKLMRNPFKKCKVRDPHPTEQPCFTPEQVALLLATAEGPMRDMVIVLVHAGLRFGELRDLRWDRLDFEKKKITVDAGGSGGSTKDRDRRVIPMYPLIEESLRRAPRLGERVFYQGVSEKYPSGDNPLDERRLLRSFKRLCERAGVVEWEKFSLHSCRRTFASMLARSNVSYKYALEFMGHSESQMLDHYFKMFDEDAARAISSIRYPQPNAGDDTKPNHPSTNN